jgi:hypothetical protein
MTEAKFKPQPLPAAQIAVAAAGHRRSADGGALLQRRRAAEVGAGRLEPLVAGSTAEVGRRRPGA